MLLSHKECNLSDKGIHMKNKNQFMLLGISSIGLLLAGCKSDVQSAISISENLEQSKNDLVSQFTELSTQEKQLQSQFEKTLQEDESFETISDESSDLFTNLKARTDILEKMTDTHKQLEDEYASFEKLDDKKLPVEKMDAVKKELSESAAQLKAFTDMYTDSLSQQKDYFLSLAEDTATYETFTEGIHGINEKQETISTAINELDGHLVSLDASNKELHQLLQDSKDKK